MSGVITSKENVLTPPESGMPIDVVLNYTIKVAGAELNVMAICNQFKHADIFTRQDVKEFIKKCKQKISGLEGLEDAILGKTGDMLKAKRIIVDVYDEIIDKMVTAELLAFHAGLSPEFENQLINGWAKATT